MKIKIQHVVIAVFFIMVFTTAYSPSATYAQEVKQTPTLILNSKEDTYFKEQYELLKEVALKHEERVNTEREDLISLSKLILDIFVAGGLIAIVSFIVTLYGVNRKAKKYLNDVIVEKGGDLKRDAERWAKGVVDSQFGFDKQVLVLADQGDNLAFSGMEAVLLKKRGFGNIKILPIGSEVDGANLIIFVYNDTLANKLAELIDKLVADSQDIPLLIYHTGTTNVDRALTKKYPLHTFAQTPLTLVSWTFTILSSMPNHHKENL